MLKVLLIGFCGGDPTMRYAPSGDAVTSFSVASTRKWKGNDGEQKEETTWVKCTLWGKRAEVANEYLHKGSKVYVEGTLVPDENGGPKIWEGNDGKPHASFEIRVNDFQFLDSKSKSGQAEHQESAEEDL